MATVAVTIGVAVVTGHIMQYGLSFGSTERAARVVADVAPEPAIVPAVTETRKAALPDALPTPPAAALIPASVPFKVVTRDVVPADNFQLPDTTRHQNLNAFGIPCETRVTATPQAAAMVRLETVATCRPNERVEVRHGALRFAAMTSSVGDLSIEIPALVPSAVFDLTFEDGETLSARAVLPQAEDYDRVALQWTGAGAMSIHAFEFGATHDEPGHVYRGRSEETFMRTDHAGGAIFTLGEPGIDHPAMAEIYSFPRGQVTREGVVRLHVEAEVTPFTCGKQAEAEAVQTMEGDIRAVTVRLAMPNCDAVGDILVLKNILRDLKIASN